MLNIITHGEDQMITVEDIMTRNPESLSRYNSLSDARKLMTEKHFRHIPIVDDNGELIGLVTQRNVLAHGIASQDFADAEELDKIEQGTLLADIMTAKLVTVLPEVKIASAAQLVHKHKFGCLPVVDSDNKLVGIITDHDFVEITIQLLEMMESTEPMDFDD
ncbi:HPP family protein [Aliikangiella sp. G2MR2-5]|uniref:CBS domain-containing protein n=1 Tax=Aliikangiella sp. G2MR2-5 TaxID=2788943 RepID=UPI0018AC03A9|nr:CBS domain-containing protein [Aliikangiella sp. G2MR2-5]